MGMLFFIVNMHHFSDLTIPSLYLTRCVYVCLYFMCILFIGKTGISFDLIVIIGIENLCEQVTATNQLTVSIESLL